MSIAESSDKIFSYIVIVMCGVCCFPLVSDVSVMAFFMPQAGIQAQRSLQEHQQSLCESESISLSESIRDGLALH